MDYEKEFPHIFNRKLCIKSNRIKLNSVVNEPARVTRSSKKEKNKKIEWVRVKNGVYRGDIARVLLFDEKNSQVHVELFPRNDSEHSATGSKRRPPLKLHEGLIRKIIPFSDVESEGLLVTAAEMKRFRLVEGSMASKQIGSSTKQTV